MKKFYAGLRLFCISINLLFIAFISVLIFPVNLNAQKNKGLPFITNYRYQDYNAGGVNWWAAEDDKGVMYFANAQGVLVFDGQHWETITPPGSVETRSVVKGKDGKIYVGTNGDIGYIDRSKKGKLEFVSLKNKIPEKDKIFNEAWEVHEFNGSIFFRTTNKIFRWENNSIKVYESKEGFHTGDVVNGNYYVRIWGRGLTVLKEDSFHVVPNGEKFSNERIYAYVPYEKDKMLIGTRTQGLFIYDGKDFTPFKTEADQYLVNKSLYGGLLLSNGYYAFNSFNDGIVIIDKQGKLIQVIDKSVGLMDNAVDFVFEDSRNNLWMPLFNGIAKFDLHSSLTYYNETMGLPGKAVFNVGIINDTVYAGTNTGVYMLNKFNNRFERLAGSSGQIGNFILNGNDLLVAAAENGLQKIKGGKIASVITSVNYDFNMNGFQQSKKDATLFYCSLRSGMAIVKYNPNNGTYSIQGFNPDISIGNTVNIETEEGNLWIPGENPGEIRLLKFNENGVSHTLEKVPVVIYTSSQGLPTRPVNMLEYDGKAYYFSEKDSIFVFDKNQNRFVQDKNVLWSKSSINNALGTTFHDPDQLGRIWANSGSGVFVKLPTTDGSVKVIDAPFRELRKNYPVWSITPSIDKDGKEVVWFSSNEGIIRYDGNLAETKSDSIHTIIRGITLNEDSVFYSGFELPLDEPDFSHKWNTVRFQFAAPFFKQENEILFSTYLEGWDKGWSDWSKQSYREFGNLSGGTYTFRVKSKNIYDVESEEVIYTFSVSPPWYGSWWAYILYALLAAAIIYLIVRWRTQHLHEKHRELEKVVAERTYQLSHRVEELAVINSVQEGLVSEMNMSGIYELVGEKIREIFDAQVIDIVTYDSLSNLLEDRYAYEKGDRTLVGSWEPKGFRKHVIETGQLLLINKDLDQKSVEFGSSVIHGEQPKSAVFVPMISRGKVMGMISLQNLDKENAFSDSSVNLLTTLANSMSVALESAKRFDETTRLLKETEQRTAELAVINSVQDGLARELDIHGIYKLVGDRLCTLFPDTQTLVIRTFNHLSNQEYFEYFIEKGEHMKVDPRSFMWANKQLIQTKQALLINEDYVETAKKYGGTGVTKGQPPKSAVFVPMIVGEVVKGSISLQNVDKEFGYSDSDLRLLTTLTNSMSVALENARLFDETNRLLKETEQRTAELAVINSVQEGLVREMDMQAIYDLVGNRLYELFNTTNLVIRTFDHDTGKEHWRYANEKGRRQYIEPKPFIWANRQLIQTKKPIHINENYVETAKKYGGTGVSIGQPPKSAVFVPMIVGDVVKGSVSLQNIDKENAYTEADLRLLTTLTNSMSVALENARLFDETNRLLKETEQRNAELAVINSVQDGLVREMDMQGIYELVGEKIREIFDAQVIDIVTYDKKANLIEDRYAYEKGDRSLIAPRAPKGFRRHVIETKTLLLHNENVEQAMKDYNNEILIGEMPKSQVYVPMIAGSEVTGIISLQNIDHENAFSESDVRLINTLANTMSIALESARNYDETKRLLKETEQRNAELAVINSVQDGLVREMDMEGIYELVGEKIREIFDAQVIDIVMYDRKTKMIEDRYSYEKGDRTLLGSRKPFGFRKHVIENKVEMMINKDLEKLSVEYNSPVIQGETPKSMIMVPMIAGSNITGIISLQNIDHEDAFSESDLRLINTLANTMSIALESARLFDETKRLLKETKQRNAELAVINSVQDGLVREMDMQGIYELVGEKIREIFDAQVIDIVTYDSRTNLIEDRYSYEKGDRSLLGPRAPKGFRKHIIETGQLLLHNDNVERAMREFDNEVMIGEMPKSQVYVPMITGGEVNGIISLQNIDHEHAFSESDIRLINTLANTMSIALGSARLFDETKRLLKETEQRTAELSVINSVQEGLVREMDIQGIYTLVGDKMRDIFNAQVFDIVTYDKSTDLIEDRYTYEKGDQTLLGPRPLKGFRKHVIETARPLIINNNLDEQRLIYDQKVLTGVGAKSLVMVPMIAAGEATGVISLQNLDQENAFSDSDVRLLGTFSSSMSVALENARLFDETTRLLKETEQRTAELAVINSVQDGLAKELDIKGIYTLVGERIRELFDAQVVAIATFNHEDQTEKFEYIVEKGERFYPEARPIGKLRLHLIKTRQKIIINKQEESYAWFGTEVVPGTEPLKSGVFVPLIIGDKITSYVTLQNVDRENAFNESDVRLLETLANSMSVALENARLFDETTRLLKETEQRTAELAVINSVQDGLATELDIQGIYNLVGDRIRDLFDAQVVAIATFNHEDATEKFQYIVEKGERFYPQARPFDKLRTHLIATRQKILINSDFIEAYNKFGMKAVSGTALPKSALFVPLSIGDKITSYVTLQNIDRENAFSDSDVRLLETLANSMSVALENARLFDETTRLLKETEQRTAELAVINSVQEGLAKELDMQAIYDLIGDRIIKVFNAPNLVIRTFDHDTGKENWRYAIEKGERQYIEPKQFVWHSKQLIQTQKPIHINEDYLETSKKFGGTGVFVGQPTKSGIFVPMIVGGIVKGSVSLQNVDKEFAYNDADLRLLTTITNSMSVALENARLFDETNRLLKETEQRTAELAVINSVQEGLVREMDMQGIYDLVGDRVQTLFNAQAVIIGTFDLDNKTEYFNYVFENGERVKIDSRPINKLRQLIIDKKHTIYISTEEQAKNEFGVTAIGETKMPRSLLFVPLLSGIIIRGYVSLQNIDIEHAFSDSDIRLLETLANSMSVALENARLFDETNRLLKETEQRTAELAVINSVQDGLAKELDIQGIYDLVGDRLCDLFPDTQTLVIRTFDHDTGNEHFQYAIEKGERLEVEARPFMWANQQLIRMKKAIDIKENYVKTAQKFGGSGVTKGKPPKSAVFVPMIVGDVVRGSISLQNVDRENAFNESDLRLLTTITNSMSVALENARLFDETHRLLKETEQRTAELAVINSVQDGLVREMNMQAIYDLVGNRICELFDTQTVLIRTFDHRTGQEIWQYVIEKGERLYSNPRPIIWANKRLIETKESLLINEHYLETAQKFGGSGVSKGLPPKSALFVPMIVGDVVKGSVSLQNVEKENAFTESDLRLLTTLTNSMSVALENARLFDESNRLLNDAKQRASELATVNNITQALASQINLEELIELVGDEIRQLFRANITYLALLDKETNMINFPYRHGDIMEPMKMGDGLSSKIILTGEPLLINKDILTREAQMGIKTVGIPAASYLGVPILVGDEVIGVLSVQSTEQENRFNEDDLRLLNTIATSVGVALRKAKLFEEIHLAKQDAENAKKTAERANEAKSAFLSTVSHELRTPLTSVLGFAKIIKKRLDEKIFPITDKSDPKTAKTIKQIVDNLDVVVSEGQRLTHLINDVLDLAKIEAGKMEWNSEPVSIPEITERAIAATTALFESNNLKLVKEIKTDIPDITGDKDKLIQVMVNLISNAVKFSLKGKVTIKVQQEKDEIIASITDTGIGIAPEDHAAVFEQFKQVGDTLTDKPKGTGLGLPICKEIVEHHGGRIYLESELGKGSTFYVAIPITKSGSETVSRPIHLEDLVKQLKEQVAHSQLNIIGSSACILVVDDDDSIRSLLHQELGEAGYEIIEAGNGKEALECVRKRRPDLIILDIMMPEMNGFDVAAVLKNDPNTMDIPIIVLSIVQDKTRGFRIGVDRYLTKPIDTGLLFNEIGSLLEQGKSKKKVMIVDEDGTTVNTLTDVLKAKGYTVMESNGKELMEKAIANQPDIIIMNSVHTDKQDVVKSLRFEKGMENVLFLVYQ